MKRVSVWFITMLDTWITWGDSFPQLQSLLVFWKAPVWRCDGTPPGDHWCVTRQPGARPSGKPNRSRRTAGWHRMCFFSITKPFCEEKLLGTKRFVDKGHESLIISEKNTSWQRSHFIVLVPYFRWMNFLGIFLAFQAKHSNSKNHPFLPFVPLKTSSKTSGTGLLGGGRAAGHLWIATQAPWIG